MSPSIDRPLQSLSSCTHPLAVTAYVDAEIIVCEGHSHAASIPPVSRYLRIPMVDADLFGWEMTNHDRSVHIEDLILTRSQSK